MSVFKVERKTDYVVIPNGIFRERTFPVGFAIRRKAFENLMAGMKKTRKHEKETKRHDKESTTGRNLAR